MKKTIFSNHTMTVKHLFLSGLLLMVVMSNDAVAKENRELIEQLKQLSLEDLSEIETLNPQGNLSARKAQKLTETAGALFVITQEDIRRAGITRISEALRMVPGIQVARLDTHQWAISARGFNQQYASKLLVMIDGRTVYSPLRSQVNWDMQDLLIEDIERIEVIRGSGAALWGANAMNGVINIVTQSSDNTQDNLITTHLGNGEEQAIVGIRHGGQLKKGHYRIYGKFYQHDSFIGVDGHEQQNDWQVNRGGGRMDWEANNNDTITVQGDIYQGVINRKVLLVSTDQSATEEDAKIDITGFNLLARWHHILPTGDVTIQSYYDFAERKEFYYEELRGIYDLDFQHRWELSERHELLWGLGFRYTYDNIEGTPLITYEPDKRQDSLYSAFVRSEFQLPQQIRLTIGAKLEHNDYTGFEIQPTARILWNIEDKHNFWAAISRAVRTPSRDEENIRVDVKLSDIEVFTQGNTQLKSEELIAYELGYRFNLANQFLLDVNLFYNDYDKLRTQDMIDFRPFPPPPFFLYQRNNGMEGEAYGLELAIHWQATQTWKLIGSYSYLDTHLHLKSTSNDDDAEFLENNNPHHQANLRSLLSLPHNLEFDTALYYVDNVSNQKAPHYTRFDVRLGWQPTQNFDLGVGIRNLFDKRHLEFGSENNQTTFNEVSRAFYLQLKYRF
jgi:iron complex outermembrane recepter protein